MIILAQVQFESTRKVFEFLRFVQNHPTIIGRIRIRAFVDKERLLHKQLERAKSTDKTYTFFYKCSSSRPETISTCLDSCETTQLLLDRFVFEFSLTSNTSCINNSDVQNQPTIHIHSCTSAVRVDLKRLRFVRIVWDHLTIL